MFFQDPNTVKKQVTETVNEIFKTYLHINVLECLSEKHKLKYLEKEKANAEKAKDSKKSKKPAKDDKAS